MKVHELIDALSALDKYGDANAAIKEIRAKLADDARRRLRTPEGIREAFFAIREAAASHVDSRGNTNEGEDLDLIAFNGVRSDVFSALAFMSPAPEPDPEDDGDPELHHARQKVHNKKLWRDVDALVSAAGLTAKGQVS